MTYQKTANLISGSAVFELTNQSTLGIQKGGLKKTGTKEHFR